MRDSAIKRGATLPILPLMALACATPYQPEAFAGGYSEIQMQKLAWIVQFRGNEFTRPARTEDFALLRACELVLAAGCTHYRIIDAGTASTFGGAVIAGTTAVPINMPSSKVGVACADPNEGLDAHAQAATIRSKYGIQQP